LGPISIVDAKPFVQRLFCVKGHMRPSLITRASPVIEDLDIFGNVLNRLLPASITTMMDKLLSGEFLVDQRLGIRKIIGERGVD